MTLEKHGTIKFFTQTIVMPNKCYPTKMLQLPYELQKNWKLKEHQKKLQNTQLKKKQH